MSVHSPFVTGLYRLGAADARARQQQVRQAVHARIDELTDPDQRLALQMVADDVGRLLLETSRVAIERLADGLAASHGEEPARPRQLPPTKPRT